MVSDSLQTCQLLLSPPVPPALQHPTPIPDELLLKAPDLLLLHFSCVAGLCLALHKLTFEAADLSLPLSTLLPHLLVPLLLLYTETRPQSKAGTRHRMEYIM